MPGSSADTFWGKGFLATALGTASPDRKKTHKGQRNVTSSSGVTSSASTERTEAVTMHNALKDFQKQVINTDLQPFLNVFILSCLKIVNNQMSHLCLSSCLVFMTSPLSRKLDVLLLLNMIHPLSTEGPGGSHLGICCFL